MTGALVIIAAILGFIAMELRYVNKTLWIIKERIADVTTEDYRHLYRIRIEKDV